MKKTSIINLFCLLWFLSTSVIAQDAIKMYPSQPWKQVFSVPGQEGFFALQRTLEGSEIAHWSDEFEVRQVLEVGLASSFGFRAGGAYQMGYRLCLVGLDAFRDNQSAVNMQLVDLATLEEVETEGVSFSLNGIPPGTPISLKNSPNAWMNAVYESRLNSLSRVLIDVSEDQNHIAFLGMEDPRDTLEGRARISVYDRDLKAAWDFEAKRFFDDPEIRAISMALGNDGTIYLLGVKRKESEPKVNGVELIEYHLLGIYNQGKDVQQFSLSTDEQVLQMPGLALTANDDLVVVGLYATPERSSNATQGISYTHISTQDRKVVSRFSAFEDAFKLQHYNPEGLEEAKRKINSIGAGVGWQLEPVKLISQEDGRLILVAEEVYKDNNKGTDFGVGLKPIRGSAVVISLSTSGVVEWQVKVPKRQVVRRSSGYGSVAVAVQDQQVWLLFNDDRRNDRYPEQALQAVENPKNYSICSVLISPSGTFEKQWLKSSNQGSFLYPKSTWKLADKPVVLFSGKVDNKAFLGAWRVE